MAYTAATLPLTGAGDATAQVATDRIGGFDYQAVKLVSGAEGSTLAVPALSSAPGATEAGMVTRPIGSTSHSQAVVGEVALTSLGSTRTVGVVTVGNPTTGVTISNPTTAVNLSSQHTVTADLSSVGSTRLVGRMVLDAAVDLSSVGSTRSVGTVNQGSPAGTSADAWWVRTVTTGSAGGSTTVDANLTSAGSTRLVGRMVLDAAVDLSSVGSTRSVGTVNQGSPAGTSADAWWVRTVTTGAAGAGSTLVDLGSGGSTKTVGVVGVSSGVILGGSTAFTGLITSGTQTIGTVELSSVGSTRSVGTINQGSPAGTSADAWWVRTVTTGSAGAGSTTVDANLTSVGSTRTVGVVGQGPGSSANFWTVQTLGFSSALTSRTTANTSANAAVIAASSAVLGMTIQNMTTVDVGLSLSTAAPSTALANIDLVLSGRNVAGGGSWIAFGYDLPNFTGNIRGITIGSTTVAGGVVVTRFLSS